MVTTSQFHLRRWISLLEDQQSLPAETPWHELVTGVPALIHAWRGQNGASTPLSDRWRLKLKRDYLLGDGFYAAPTRLMAKRFGDPVLCQIALYNPYVFPAASAATFEHFDLDACRATHDGVVIREGRAVGNEDIRQVCVFPNYLEQVSVDVPAPRFTTLQPGAKVKIRSDWSNDYARQTYGHLSGKTGVVTSITMGHPSVKIGGKTYYMSKQDVEVV